MKVLLLNTYDNKGGAARACYRLLKGLRKTGIDSELLVQNKQLDDSQVIMPDNLFSGLLKYIKPYIDYLPTFFFSRKRFPFFSAFVPDSLLKEIEKIKPDVIHLHWISEGFIKLETITKIKQPIIWTFHDFWPITGGCHLPKDCNKFNTECGNCPYLSPKLRYDLSTLNFNRKIKSFSKINKLQIVTPSNWLAKKINGSTIFKGKQITVIPNGLDTDFFHPLSKTKTKDEFGIKQDNITILFGGINPTIDKNKGYKIFLVALKKIINKNINVIVFGNKKRKFFRKDSINFYFFGKISNDHQLRKIYSAADLTVVPSKIEVFGQVITESMACGTPVVAFNSTGPAEIIKHKENGYLAKPFDPEDIAKGINWIIDDQSRYKNLLKNAREHAVGNYSDKIIAGKYLNLYNKMLLSNIK